MPEARELFIQSNGLTGVTGFVASREKSSRLQPPPHFGEHTDEVLKAMGYSRQSIIQFRNSQVIC